MDKFDEIQAEINKHQLTFENYEDGYRKRQNQLDKDFQDIESIHLTLRNILDNKSDDLFNIARQETSPPNENYSTFTETLNYLASEVEHGFLEKRRELDDRADNLEKDYKKASRIYEDELESLLQKRRKAYEEESK